MLDWEKERVHAGGEEVRVHQTGCCEMDKGLQVLFENKKGLR